jgi:methyl-accepting chemotaxis protein
MLLRNRLHCLIGSIALSLAVGSGACAWLAYQNTLKLEQLEQTTPYSDKSGQLVQQLREGKLHIVQVQRFFADIAATRGMDGLDSGFREAEDHARYFRQNIDTALSLSSTLDEHTLKPAIMKLGNSFRPFYNVGKKTAASYIIYGQETGNSKKAEADETYTKLNNAFDKALVIATTLHQKYNTQLINQFYNIRQANHVLLATILSTGGIVLFICLTVWLLIELRIMHPIALLTTKSRLLSEGNTHIEINEGNGKDEISQMAHALILFRDAAIAHKAQQERPPEISKDTLDE